VLFGAVLGFAGARLAASWIAERELLVTKPMGPEPPADCGLAFERFVVTSGTRKLQAWFVLPPADRVTRAAVLIFHGTHESIAQWVPAQQYLAENGIASMVFDYSGYGDSTGAPTVANLRQDVQAAYRAFSLRTGPESSRFLLGYSLGTGCLLEGVPAFGDSFDGVALIAAFTSARAASVARGVLPRWLSFALPDLYNNVRAMRHLHRPLLVVHSAGDERLMGWMAVRVFHAANEPKRLVMLEGLQHNGMVHGHAAEYLAPVVEFVRETATRHTPSSR
jgi:hypothetical protein